MKKTKILYITRKFPPSIGGMENFSYNLYNNFKKNNVDIDLIALRKSQINLIYFLPYALIKTLIVARKYDVIFIGDAVLSCIGFFVKLLFKKKKVIINAFGLDLTYKNIIYQFYLKIFYKNFDKYISISKETDEIVKKRGINNSVIITPGIDVDKFKKEIFNYSKIKKKYKIGENTLVLITVGRLVKRKGVNWFIRNVFINLKNEDIKYLIIGQGSDRKNIEESIREFNLQEKVKLLGKVDNEVLNSIYKNADSFIMPNIYVEGDMEGFGMVALEASLAGLYVIASNIEGIKDAIINKKNGCLIESMNAKEYYNKIIDLYYNKEKYRKIAKGYRRYTKNNFSWESICDKYYKLVSKMLDEDKY